MKLAKLTESIKECLERVNEFRSIHDVVPLTINEKLNTEAQDWAKHLADKDGLEHSPKDSRKNGKGENLFGFTGDQQIVTAFDKWYAEEDEYDYKKNKYVSSAGNFTQLVWAGYGHLTVVAFVTSLVCRTHSNAINPLTEGVLFAQYNVILAYNFITAYWITTLPCWPGTKDTKQIGIGWAKSTTGWTYICARFDPTGNMVVTPPGEEACMKQNVKKPSRRDAKKIAKQLEEKKFKEPGKDDMKEFVGEVNK